MAEAAGFEMYDIGIDRPVCIFVEKVKDIQPYMVGMSGVLILELEVMKDTVDGLKEAELSDNLKKIIGGNPVTKKACIHIGVAVFAINTAQGVKICQEWISPQ